MTGQIVAPAVCSCRDLPLFTRNQTPIELKVTNRAETFAPYQQTAEHGIMQQSRRPCAALGFCQDVNYLSFTLLFNML